MIDYCPEYNTGANTLDTVPCNVSSGCPDVLYLSDEVYKCKIFFSYFGLFTIQIYIYFKIIKNLIWTQLLDPLKTKKNMFLRFFILLRLRSTDHIYIPIMCMQILHVYFSDRFIYFIYLSCIESRSQSMSVCYLNHAFVKRIYSSKTSYTFTLQIWFLNWCWA